MITPLGLCELTHRQCYFDICMVAAPILALLPVVLLLGTALGSL